MRNRPMTVAASRPDETTILVTIDHDTIASYSRSVQPRAQREARQVITSGQWALVDVDYDQSSPEGDRRARSIYRYERQAA